MTLSWKTRLIQPQVSAPEGFRSLATPVYRGSTTLLRSAAEVTDHWDQRRTRYSYVGGNLSLDPGPINTAWTSAEKALIQLPRPCSNAPLTPASSAFRR